MMAVAPESHTATGSPPDPQAVNCDEAATLRAFGRLVHQHQRRVFNFLSQMTRHRQDAEDLTQQTFIKAFHHLARFDQQRPLINWLLTIARNTALNHFRDGKKWEEMPVDAASPEPAPDRQAEQRERSDNLWARARELLSAREFEVLWLRFAEELSTRETATVVGLSEAYVKVLVFRARQTLLKGVKPS